MWVNLHDKSPFYFSGIEVVFDILKILLSTDEDQMNMASNQFDLIIDTMPYDHDLKPYILTLALNGTTY